MQQHWLSPPRDLMRSHPWQTAAHYSVGPPPPPEPIQTIPIPTAYHLPTQQAEAAGPFALQVTDLRD